jgi:hypothetical protein
MQILRNAALTYLKQLHYSVFPVSADKKALIKWEPYQKKLPTEEEVNTWWSKWPDANIGIATGIISGLSVIDIDEPDIGLPALAELIPDSIVFPVSKTPSGGEHWYFQCTDARIRNNAKIVPGCDLRANGGYVVAPPSVNSNGKSWRWKNDLKPTKIALPYLPKAYIEYINKHVLIRGDYKGGNECVDKPMSTNVYTMFQQGKRDEDLFHVANCLAKGKMPKEEVSQVIEKLALSCNPPFDLKEVPAKIESAFKRIYTRNINLADEVEDFVLSTTGNFLSTDVYRVLQLSTRDEHKNVSIILKRLLEKGVIEKFGDRNGSWRVIDKESQTIDWYNAKTETIDIKWPFKIEELVVTMPKNIIVVAGSPNAGKTAFMLNVVEMNMHGSMPINYFSSEMGAMELKGRLQKFDTPLHKWRFNAKERSSNFDDVIQPDDINIIDFLELSDQFYLVGGMIKKIFDKLKKGIAIIALQKNPGSTMARGGVGSLEKPRLYITLDSNRLTIEKGKNWAKELINPNKMYMNFKLVSGCKFIPSEPYDWKREEKHE